MSWWSERPIRFIQTNLREIDLPLDPQAYARLMGEYHADAVLFNLGGIVANYPTKLPFHYANPRILDDLIPHLIEELHRKGIRFVGRFDFSKVNEVIGSRHPEWLYRRLDGQPVTYNGQMHCCLNGDYQQKCSLEILKEALEWYPVDGVFFNMVGYQTTDYSGVYHGICQCENCRQRFGETLPNKEDAEDPVYWRYLRFCQETSKELFHRIRETIRGVRPECAINTYTHEGVDMIRSESNSGLRRPQPEFVYESSLNVRRVYGSWPGLVSSNAVVHFIDFPYRHAGVAPALTARRLAQNFIHGGWMDFYVIGKLDEQPDRACLPRVKELFALHQAVDDWRTGAVGLADVCLVAVDRASPGHNAEELKGLFTLLSEEHVLFDVLEEEALDQPEVENRLARYRLVILPDMAVISPRLAAALDVYVSGGGRLIVTGLSGSLDANGITQTQVGLACLGVDHFERRDQARGTYFEASENDLGVLPDLAGVSWIPMDTPWLACEPNPSAMTCLRAIPVGMFGPPEKCYYLKRGDEPGLIVNPFGEGLSVVVPWQIGTQQFRFPTHAIPRFFHSIIEHVLKLPRSIRFEAPPMVEVSAFTRFADHALLIGLVNLSGQNGRSVHDPLPIRNLRIGISRSFGAVSAQSLSVGELASEPGEDYRWIELPQLELCDMLKIHYLPITEV